MDLTDEQRAILGPPAYNRPFSRLAIMASWGFMASWGYVRPRFGSPSAAT